MSAIEALRLAREAGVVIGLNGDMLKLRAKHKPAPEVLAAIRRNKPEILAMLRKQAGIWTPEDYRTHFDERAGIIQFDAGEPRPVAEARAWETCIVRWLDHNQVRSDPGACVACQRTEDSRHVVVPFGAGRPHGATWLHPHCWQAWHQERREQARATLQAMGIDGPSGDAKAGTG